ncbi:MAG: tetratricopeptide repeat protein [Ignavibacteriales bacterium]|nr:tetratricopeptide repeat protein [Ignavibacteriales bacterium]
MKKNLVLSLIAVIFIILVLVFAEIGLRLLYPSLENPLTTEVSYDGIEWYQINRSYLAKYFSSDAALIPEFKQSLFRKTKTPNLFRVFCLGESSMFGTPYQMTANIPGIVRKQLRHLYPQKEIEVINLGGAAINSNVNLDLIKEVVRYQPDLILLYLGHNEFYGPDGVGASWLEKRFGVMTQLKYQMRDLRIVTLIRKMLSESKKDKKSDEDMTLMKQVSNNNKVRLDSDDAARVFQLFESNLKNIISVCKNKNIPVVISDVTSNLMFPPFLSDDLHGINQQNLRAEIETQEQAGNYQSILDRLSLIQQTDSSNAFCNFWIGKAYLGLRQPKQAKQYFIRARENDLLKFRAPEHTNTVIRKVCSEEHVPLISSDSLFVSMSENGITGNNLFWEHLHPNALGYYLIANLYVDAIRQLHLNNLSPEPALADRLPFHPDSLSICWLDLAYADLSMQNLTGKWPFDNYKVKPVAIDPADEVLKRIAHETFARKLVWDEGCYQTASHFLQKGMWRDAATTYEAILEEYPYNFYAHALLGNVLMQNGKTGEAIRHLEASINSNPTYPNPRLDLGLVQINSGKFDEAIGNLTQALSLTSDKSSAAFRANIYYGLAAAYANKQQFVQSLQNLDESLRLFPDYEAAKKLRSEIVKHR